MRGDTEVTSRPTAAPDDPARLTPARGWLASLARFAIRRRWAVVALSGVLAVVASVMAIGLPGRLLNGGYIPADAEAQRAARFLAAEFNAGPADLVLIASTDLGVDAPAAAERGQALTALVDARADVVSVQSYWAAPVPALKSRDGRSALLLITLAGDEDARQRSASEIHEELDRQSDPLTLQATGVSVVNADIVEQSEKDLIRAETLATPVTLIILLLVFGSLVAAAMPVVVAAVAVLGSLALLYPLAGVTDVSVFALNVATALGFGLAVDYSLFIVTRYREELAAGRDQTEAIVTAVATAGRTVLFSAATVALSLAALLVYPLFFLQSIAYSAMLVVFFGGFASVVVLPAVLAVLGPRLFRFSLPWTRGAAPARSSGWWHRQAGRVMRRPVLMAAPVVALLVFLALPFADVRFGLADARVLPEEASAAQAAQKVEQDFDRASLDAITVALPDVGQARSQEVAEYAVQLSRLPHVAHVDSVAGRHEQGALVAPPTPLTAAMATDRHAYLNVVTTLPVNSDDARDLVRRVRDVSAPGPALVGGPTATLVDTIGMISGRLPWALTVIGVTTMVLLFLFAGSILVPLKAVLLNLLSLTATFGAMVYIFQEGHLKWLVGDFTHTGYLEVTIPVLVFCIAFGLSMDYEVFMLSRIREEYLRHRDNTAAVAWGLEKTGRLISAAALIVASVLVSLATSQLSLLKLLGVALAMAVITDAILVRAVLVPAFMRLAGRANWWAPRPLARLHQRIGLREE